MVVSLRANGNAERTNIQHDLEMPRLDLDPVLTGQRKRRFHRISNLATVEVFVRPVVASVPGESASVVFGEVFEVSDEMVPDLAPVVHG